ncbi:16S rRNA (cytosine(967)-C(5))-methyltransferase RsmB [uncultured Limosilactobacillus sp.]|uniref:16S rRNA (cytosine(967)-C(5))-methyltransferase RsmB n=1 Tax=uncultured Limosilactobacillus sp. TaxID=2837629 RepID=UPI0025D1B5F0|nr:16S rRNA (cytosine(967)-C(5))-methyltransferase RsmB [uncultured Limosilactobacillus sp.]
MNNSIKNSPRNLALETLDKVFQRGSYSNLQLNETLMRSQLKEVDRRLVTNLVYGVLQHKITLEYWIKPLFKREPQPWVKTLLMISLYQYQFMDRIPEWAITDEAIKIAKWRGNPGIRKFVTGVLHTFLRQGPRQLTEISDPVERLSVSGSLPKWLVQTLIDQYGMAKVETLVQVINQPSKVSLRVNTALVNFDEAIDKLHQENIKVHPSKVSQDGLIVDAGNILSSKSFANGVVTVQDESAMLAVEALQLVGNERVLDACAAPGGKTGQIAAALNSQLGHVDALDIHQHKVRLIESNMKRLGVADRVSAHQLDARQVDRQFANETFDKVLVDAPCSGIGLIRRKPEIRYAKDQSTSEHLHEIQGEILNTVAPKVKKGGIIVYSTCTILQEENERTIQTFLSHHANFQLLKTQTARAIKDDRQQKTLTILPSDYDSDGFFIGTLQRIK